MFSPGCGTEGTFGRGGRDASRRVEEEAGGDDFRVKRRGAEEREFAEM